MNIKNLLILILFSSLFTQPLLQIKISGNRVTKEEIILREIHHPIAIEYSDSIRIQDQNRIYNLGIFSLVEISQQKDIYQINVKEVFRYYPLPLFDFDESKGKEGASYGFALNILNLNGKNRQLEFGGMYGNKNVYFIRYMDPWILGDHISFKVDLYQILYNSFIYKNHTEHQYSNFIQGFEIGSGFNIGQKPKFKFNVSFAKNNLTFTKPLIPIPDNFTKYQNLTIDANYLLDSRDIFIDPTFGKLFKIHVNKTIGFFDTESFSNIYLEYNQYNKVSNFRELILISRTKFLIQNESHIPYFNYESLGGEDFVRGYNPSPIQNELNVRDRIQYPQICSQSFELQYTLIEKKSYNGGEFGLDNLWFVDIGLGGHSLNDFKNSKPLIGFGTGFRFYISGFGTIGVDFGFNPTLKKPQLHISDGKDD